MCLYIDYMKTLKELEDRNPRTFYKIFIRFSDYLLTPYWSFQVPGPGTYVIMNPQSLKEQGMINEGAFHARTKESALQQDIFFCEFFEKGEPITVPVNVKAKDIIAFGMVNEAFKAFTITDETWSSI